MTQMKMKSKPWLFGLLGLMSLGSVFYTAFIGEIGTPIIPERKIESQRSIDTLTSDMKRLMKNISGWEAFCHDPHSYLKSANSHGTLAISIRDQWSPEEIAGQSRIMRDAIHRCMNEKSSRPGQIRLCMTVKDLEEAEGWFNDAHLLEVNFEFRKKGSKLIADCTHLKGQSIEVQSYFSAYSDNGLRKRSGRVSGGLRLPLELARL